MKNAAHFIQNIPANHYVNEAKANLERINGSIAYCNEALACETLAAWERKEYEAVLANAQAELVPASERLAVCLKIAA